MRAFQRSVCVVLLLGLVSAFAAAPRPDLNAAAKRWLGDSPGGVSIAYVDRDGVALVPAPVGPGRAGAVQAANTTGANSASKVSCMRQ